MEKLKACWRWSVREKKWGTFKKGVVDRGDVAFRHMKVDTLTILSTCVDNKNPLERTWEILGRRGGG